MFRRIPAACGALCLSACLDLNLPQPLESEDGVVRLTDEAAGYVLRSSLPSFEDRTAQMTLADVRARDGQFMPSTNVSYGFSNQALWLRMSLDHRSARQWYLYIHFASLDQVWIYLPESEGGYREIKSGRELPLSAREYPHEFFVFELPPDLRPDQPVYVRIATRSTLFIPSVLVMEAEAFRRFEEAESLFFHAVLGIILGIGIYNLLLYFSIRERVYLYYVTFVFCALFFWLCLLGSAYRYLWPESPGWDALLQIPLTIGFILSIVAFTRLYLQTPQRMPLVDRALLIAATVYTAAAVVGFLSEDALILNVYTFLALVALAPALVAGRVALWQGYRPAVYFVAAQLTYLMGMSVWILWFQLILPVNDFVGSNAPLIAHAIEAVLWSLGLADVMKEGARSQAELKVVETELDIAQSVQQNILHPPTGSAPWNGMRLNITYLPMNGSVSGDYYNAAALQDGRLS